MNIFKIQDLTPFLGIDALFGNAGNDSLSGGGDDLLLGSNVSDFLDGGDDNGSLFGEGVNNMLNGGEGGDIGMQWRNAA